MKKLKVGVAGLGMMGEVHTAVFQSLSNVEVVGCVETDATRAEAFAKRTGLPVYQTVEEILPLVDAISICTPDNLHKDFILKAFASNVKCLVEKPLEVTSKDCEEIIAAMPDETYLMVGHLLRFDPRLWRAKQALQSGDLGKIQSINIWRHNSKASGLRIGKRTSITWFLGIHDIDAILWLTGQKVARVSAMGKKLFTNYWDYVVSLMELDDGTIVCMENGWHMPLARVTGLDAGIKIIGETGMVEVNLTHADVRLTTEKSARSMMLDTYHWPDDGKKLHGDLRVELEAFVDAVVHNTVPPCTAREGAEAVKVIERIEAELDKQYAAN